MQRLFFRFRKIFNNFQSVEIKFLFLLFQNDIYPCGSPSIAQKNFFIRSLPFKKVLSPFNVCLLKFRFYCNPLKLPQCLLTLSIYLLIFLPLTQTIFQFYFLHIRRALLMMVAQPLKFILLLPLQYALNTCNFHRSVAK